MKAKQFGIVLTSLLVPVILLADDNVKEANSKKEGSSDLKTQEEQAAPRGEARSPLADPSKDPGKAGVAPEVPKMPGTKFEGTITAVDAAAKTVTIDDKSTGLRTIEVLDDTKAFTGLQSAAWGELTVGAQVKGVFRKDGDKLIAESLSIVR